MTFSTGKIRDLITLINKIKVKTFAVETQYKFLKILKIAREEAEILDEQQMFILNNYAEKDDEGKIIFDEQGGIKIKTECLQECTQKILEINSRQTQFPDIYFSIDEFESLDLTLGELILLEPFIKT